ncbi:MAG: hypothetical protein COA59_11140 [Colwellia sp.]|nr:MAG: hypothetical protein COA59_11140 [Colwellia sp.]
MSLETPAIKNHIVLNAYQVAQNHNVSSIIKEWERTLGLNSCFKGEDKNFHKVSKKLRFLAYRNLLKKDVFYQNDYMSAASLGEKVEALSVVAMLMFKKALRKLLPAK